MPEFLPESARIEKDLRECGILRKTGLVKASCTTIRRHVKIRAGANVFNLDHSDYFVVRRQDQRRARQADYKRRKQWEREEAWEHAA